MIVTDNIKKNYQTINEIEKRHHIATENATKCENCGHKIFITNKYKKVICNWCGNLVFKDKKTEFMYRMKEVRNRK